MVEGEGDVESAPLITKRLITDYSNEAWNSVFVDEFPIRVGDVTKLVKNGYSNWRRKLRLCLKRPNLGGVILLLDGDIRRVNGVDFCPVNVARVLAKEARGTGAGYLFSLGVTFALQEFETWGIASCESLSGFNFSDGLGMNKDLAPPNDNLEAAPRNAKGWISDNMTSGSYSETRHQVELAKALDFDEIRSRSIRSFARFENSIAQLVSAIASNQHVSTPAT